MPVPRSITLIMNGPPPSDKRSVKTSEATPVPPAGRVLVVAAALLTGDS
jgi:hypothetical protein